MTENTFDLSCMDTTEISSEGVWFQPNDLTAQPLPIEVLVYGEDSRQYTAAMDKISRNRKTKAKTRRSSSMDVDYSEIKEASWILASRLTGGIRNAKTKELETITLHGQVYDPGRLQDLEAVYQKLTDLADQVVSFSRDQSNFLPH